MLTEVLFAVNQKDVQETTYKTCINELYKVVELRMTELNAEIL